MPDNDRQVDLTIDSGAFSGWRRNEVISVKDYIGFIHRHLDCDIGYINLDVIPGQPGVMRTTSMVEDAANASWKNLIAMRKAGLSPIPVFHMGERRYWLDKMIGEGFEHIGLGGFAKAHGNVRKEWLDQTFSQLCGSKGYPGQKIHGFGMTSIPLIFRYPWFSVDSISWRLMAGYGWILVPWRKPDGSYDYTHHWYQIGVSSGSKAAGGMHKDVLRSGNHITMVSKQVREHVLGWLKSEGFDPDELPHADLARSRVNVRFFRRAEETYKPKPFFYRKHGLFCESAATAGQHGSTTSVADFRILYTTNVTAVQSDVLQDEKIRERLLSYYFFKDSDPFDIHQYVRYGRFGKTLRLILEKERGVRKRIKKSRR